MPAIGFDRTIPRGGVSRPGSIRKSLGKDFFDRDAILTMMDKKTVSALSRFGYFTMRDARQRLRKRKSASKPGQGPSIWTSHGADAGAGFNLRMIFFYFDRMRRSVIIGPVKLNGASKTGKPVPQILEEGGIVHPNGGRGVRIMPRPYMQPAFDRQLQRQAAKLYQAGIFIRGL
ncbi:hypothetical protein SH661x_001949 [Planctomicrobium sp. SH661]|uniref:hypothetical protein n=1 Tax=Planctomicrobium sp. SH661 TaxID=3448124 RepID=UPI003F5BA9A2